MNGEVKTQLQSMTIKAAVVGILIVLSSLGLDWANVWTDEKINKLVEGIGALLTIAAFVGTYFGRKNAKTIIVSAAEKRELEDTQ